ncbi:MAG: diguanylate cyclase [Hydrogenophaga sp.]|uniref:sensor domain-containing diguanylate cyclase n=1 Tax=Hydrogenophaga sp. TaxID=1904254 RepID=UPI0025B82D44|nr:7TM diverse intracellular signaling domain-containing protein [Hydrogenophaga sp.]MBT9551323.1 diguanylate cyclase [Hydrogenophaga sp.]
MTHTNALGPPARTARCWCRLGLWALAMVWCSLVQAAPAPSGTALQPIELDGRMVSVPLAQHSVFWVDTTGTMTVQALEAQQADVPFALRSATHRVRLGERGVLWVRFDAWVRDNRSHWELELMRSGTDRVNLYHRLADGSWNEQRAGDHVPVSEWASPDRYPVFGLDTRTDAPVTYWVRIEHVRVPFSGELAIHSHSQLRELRILQQFLLGAYFGMALLLVLVAVANALVFRDTSFAAYAIYISLLGLSLAASMGVGGQFLWPHSAGWNSVAEFVLLPLAAVAALLFVRHVVQPRRIGRSLDRLSLTLAAVFLIVTAWDVIAPTQLSFNSLTVAGTLTLIVVYAMLWAAWRTGDRWVRWIALGILPVLLAGSLPVLRNFGLISSGFLTQYATVIAAAIEAPLLIYGLLQRSSLQHEAQARARALVVTEPLTGLTNRHNFMLRLHDSLVRAQRYRHKNALLLIALDNHEWFNAEHGREVADRALVLTGSLLRSVARDVDTAARVDDNQFALLMEGPVRTAQAVAAATAIVAGGLRPSDQLPTGSSLRFKVVLALLPDDGHELQLDTQVHMAWLRDALRDLQRDKRKNIETLNV